MCAADHPYDQIRAEYSALLEWPNKSGIGRDAFDWDRGQPILADATIKTVFDQFCAERRDVSHDWCYPFNLTNFISLKMF